MVLDNLSAFDQQLAHALQVDGRASFSRLAQVLGVSDQTVARRYSRLRATGDLRVLGLTEPTRMGQVQWFVRTRTTPEAALPLAQSLARRSDTSWVSLLAGGTEILCATRTGPGEGGQSLLLSALPRTARVLDVRAHCLMHIYFGGQRSLVEKLGVLDAAQIAALAEGSPAPPYDAPVGPVELDTTDRALLAALEGDGRTGIEDLAAATGIPASTARRRLEELRASGVLYFDVDLGERILAGDVRAMLWLNVPPGDLDAAGTALAGHPEVAFAGACTGPQNLYVSVMTADPAALYRYLTTSVAELPGVREVESAPVISLLKGPGGHPPSRIPRTRADPSLARRPSHRRSHRPAQL